MHVKFIKKSGLKHGVTTIGNAKSREAITIWK